MAEPADLPVAITGTLRCPSCRAVPTDLPTRVYQHTLVTCQNCGKVAAFLAWVSVTQATVGGPGGHLRRVLEA